MFFLQIFITIQNIHLNGVIHGDLKLENCLIFGNQQVKLIDFGNSVDMVIVLTSLKLYNFN